MQQHKNLNCIEEKTIYTRYKDAKPEHFTVSPAPQGKTLPEEVSFPWLFISELSTNI